MEYDIKIEIELADNGLLLKTEDTKLVFEDESTAQKWIGAQVIDIIKIKSGCGATASIKIDQII